MATEYLNIDPGFVYATWALETGYGTSDLWIIANNPAGIKCGLEYCSYSSKEEGYRAMYELLSIYVDGNLVTVEQIRNRWSESDDTNKITEIWMNVLEGN